MSEQVMSAPTTEGRQAIKQLDSHPVFRSPFVRHDVDLVEFPDGRNGEYSVIGTAEGAGVVAVPVVNFRGIDYLGLVEQYRYPVKRSTLEFVRGGANAPSAEEAARELPEETGIVPGHAEFLGTVHPDTGMLFTEVGIYLFRQQASDRDIRFTEEESGAVTSWHSVGELMGLIRSGRITCGITLSAFTLLQVSGQLRGEFL